MQDAIFRIKVAFNRDFDDVFRKKEQEICKIREKNKRITVILNDFSFDECCVVPEFSVLEKPELLFTVNDDEVSLLMPLRLLEYAAAFLLFSVHFVITL